MDAVSKDVMRIQSLLASAAKDIRMRRDEPAELGEIYAKSCDDAAVMLHKLDIEVFRLREGIGCYSDGRLSRVELTQMARNWNEDKR